MSALLAYMAGYTAEHAERMKQPKPPCTMCGRPATEDRETLCFPCFRDVNDGDYTDRLHEESDAYERLPR